MCVLGLLAAVWMGAMPAPARSGDRPRVDDGRPPAFYVRRDTWQETMRASREEVYRIRAEAARSIEEALRSDPVLSKLQPATMEIARGQKPVTIKIRVAGLKAVYLRSEFVKSKRGSCEPYLGDARLVGADGKAVPIGTNGKGVLGRFGLGRVSGHGRFEMSGQRFERGISLVCEKARGSELGLELDGRSEWLEATVGYRDEREGDRESQRRRDESRSEDVARIVVDCRSVYADADQAAESAETIERRVARDFCGAQDAREQKIEQTAGIWAKDWPAGDIAALARRYAGASADELRKKAHDLAGKARTPADLSAVRGLFYFGHARQRLDLARRTLNFVQFSVPLPVLAARLEELTKQVERFASVGGLDERGVPADGRALDERIGRLRRAIILSHPLLSFEKLLINKRPPPLYSHMVDQYLGRHSQAGAGLVVLENWKDAPVERPLLAGKLPEGSVLHPDLSYDAARVVFGFCDHSEPKRELRRFFLYELDLRGGGVRQLTGTAADPLAGWDGRHTVLIEDFDPAYLPDGGIAFTSTRCQTFGRCHGGRYTPAYMIYRCEGDGSRVRQISYGEANEWDPSVLPDGRIVYTRWDYINRHDVRYQSLWTMYPDGRSPSHYYGNYSSSPCMTAEAKSVPGSHLVVSTAMAHHSYTAGTLMLVDNCAAQDHLDPLRKVTPEIAFPEASDRGRFEQGAYCNPWPLSEDLFLAAYTPNKHRFQGSVQETNAYGIYLVDTLGGRELIYRDPNMSCFSPIPIQPRPMPPILPDLAEETAKRPDGVAEDATGVFYLKDVHVSTEPIAPGTIKALRVNLIIGQPTAGHPARSMANNEIVKRPLGTVPVEPDGSAAFAAPAGVPMQLQALDANGLAVMTMRSLVFLQPGERTSCVGCHEDRLTTGVSGQMPLGGKIHDIRKPKWLNYEGGFSFARTVQPVLDRYCIRCHGLDAKLAGEVSLLGTRQDGFSTAYCSLFAKPGLIKLAQRNQETGYSKPRDYFAAGGKLAAFLMGKHRARAKMDAESFERVITWLDLNAQFYGDYSRNRAEDRRTDPAAEKTLREHVRATFGEKLAGEPLAALVNIAIPSESRILMAPLAASAGGWGQIDKGGWASTDDAGYRKMKRLVEAVIVPCEYHDIAGGCGQKGCRCGSCWVRKAEEDYKAKLAAQAGGPAAAPGK